MKHCEVNCEVEESPSQRVLYVCYNNSLLVSFLPLWYFE